MEGARKGLISRNVYVIAWAIALISSNLQAQSGEPGAPVREGVLGTEDVGPRENGQQDANPRNQREGDLSGGVPVNERSFQEGTVILTAPRLFGDWLGRRPAWEESGFKPTLSWVSDFGGNPVGGRNQGFAECENLGLDLMFDLEKCQGIRDTYFHVSMSQRSGTSLTNDYIGNVFSTQEIFGGETFKLVNVEVQKYFCDRAVDVKLGRIAAGDDFLVSPFFWAFMSGGIDGPPGIYREAPGMTGYPNATWGARVKARLSDRSYAMFGLYNGDPSIRSNDFHGCNLSMNGPLFAIAEVGYQRNGHADDEGKLGNFKLGGYCNGGSFYTFSPSQFAAGAGGAPPSTVSSNWGYYALFDQVIFQPYGKADPHAAGIFASFVVAPDQSINDMPFSCTGGVLIRGLTPGRPTDSIGFGVVYGKFSSDLQAAQQVAQVLNPTVGVQEYELVLEWDYRMRIRDGAMFLQPDVQYVVNPGAAHQYSNALQVGAQAGVNF